MRILFIILGIITAIIALVLAILPFGLIALIPAAAALIFGFVAYSASKKEGKSKKPVQLIFLLTIIALLSTTYRSIFTENKIESDTEFMEKAEESKEEAIEELEDMEEIEAIEDTDTINGGSSD